MFFTKYLTQFFSKQQFIQRHMVQDDYREIDLKLAQHKFMGSERLNINMDTGQP